jgi:hypothetical protein
MNKLHKGMYSFYIYIYNSSIIIINIIINYIITIIINKLKDLGLLLLIYYAILYSYFIVLTCDKHIK